MQTNNTGDVAANNADTAAAIPWGQSPAVDERERRQRSVRVWMIFLFVLLLLDEDNGNNNNNSNLRGSNAADYIARHQTAEELQKAQVVYRSRRGQDETLQKALTSGHVRYQRLMQANEGKDIQKMIEDWVIAQSEMERDEFFVLQQTGVAAATATSSSSSGVPMAPDPEADRKVFHYPWNTTGFYRGEWKLMKNPAVVEPIPADQQQYRFATVNGSSSSTARNVLTPRAPRQVEPLVPQLLQHRNETVAAVVLLPYPLVRRDDHNLTSTGYDTTLVDMNGKIVAASPTTSTSNTIDQTTTTTTPKVTLTQDTGRAAFQLFSRKIPGMREMSVVDGFVKLYESSNNQGYSTRKDMLLRVRGVLFHSIGKLSLVNYHAVDRTALIIRGGGGGGSVAANGGDENGDEYNDMIDQLTQEEAMTLRNNRLLTNQTATTNANNDTTTTTIPPWSDYVIPYPFFRDSAQETFRKGRTQAARLMPPREQALEFNAAQCDFEINMNIHETEWKVGAWRKLVARRVAEARHLDPTSAATAAASSAGATTSDQQQHASQPLSVASVAGRGRRRRKPVQDEALVMHMTGTIYSHNCKFTAHLNTTALRTDWDAATGKAITYSLYMLIVCLTQMVLLFRQVLHSQTLSTASRVSILSVGWHTTIDALMCLVHIYLSLAMSPLFTAFASVAFFKLLIFCVIEMKYMIVIVQARNSSQGGGQSAEAFRRQVAILHLRFYIALLSVFIILFYAIEKYRTASVLLLYSFWVPQIVLNVVTEARSPLNRKYIYGMSITRIVAPLYVFAVRDNFLKEVFPECPKDGFLVLKLAIWIAIQAALLISQEKYGPRFMIPARFLPPKFDYSRPLPASMIPTGALDMPAPEVIEDRSNSERSRTAKKTDDSTAAVVGQCRHKTSETTRNRLKANRNNIGTMVSEEHHRTASPSSLPVPTLECSICYDDIDIRDRANYMLAPCNHLFHRDCLTRWMDAKLECPICRTSLPSL